MNPEQRKLARHALGLPNDRRRSYRNRYFVSGGPNAVLWSEMEAAGEAGSKANGPGDFYWLTLKGAQTALHPGEGLCPEDFPDAAITSGDQSPVSQRKE